MEICKQIVSREELLREIRQGALVLTGNERLSKDLGHAYEMSMIADGHLAWQTPVILSWDQWIAKAWDEVILSGIFSKSPIVLSPIQERVLWEKVVTGSDLGKVLLQTMPTIKQVRDAWKLMHEWKLSSTEGYQWHNEDSRAFFSWCSAFQTILDSHRYLTSAQLPDQLRELIACDQYGPHGNIILDGFDELTPQQQDLLQCMTTKGVGILWHENPSVAIHINKLAVANAREEAYLAARWTRFYIEQNPELRICIVVPELEKQRSVLLQVFDEILCPERALPGYEHTERPYNISFGLPLAKYPVVQIAMLLLSASPSNIPINEISQLLHSPFIEGWDDEFSARALLDNRIREDAELYVSLYRLITYANEQEKPYHCPILARLLSEWKAGLEKLPRKQSIDKWVDAWFHLLYAAGWSRGRSLSSDEYQVVQAWNELLPALASLDPVIGITDAQRVMQELRHLASERLFQPKSSQTQIQIMGVWETSGLLFDKIWIMGLHDGIWPPAPHPNPFLPLRMQWHHHVPHSSASREYEVVSRITQRLLGSAQELIVSYPLMSDQEELRPSPLLAEINLIEQDRLPFWQDRTWKYYIHESGEMAILQQDPVPQAEPSQIRGGSRVFRLQALCPFRAFAEIRLGARKPGVPVLGLDPKKRGILVHRVLEKTWSELRTWEHLLALSQEQRQQLLTRLIEQVLDESERDSPYTFTRKFKLVEHQRVLALILEWLGLEEKRAPFSVVSCEMKIEQEVAGIPVRLSIDRVDELLDGRKILIDYKTGEVKPSQWFGDRPEEPQLPLYATVMGDSLAAVSFAQLKQGSLGFNGVAEDGSLIEGVKQYSKIKSAEEFPTWTALLEEWKKVIDQLGTDFRNGVASVSPKDPVATCKYCDMELLCRVFEASDQTDEEMEDE